MPDTKLRAGPVEGMSAEQFMERDPNEQWAVYRWPRGSAVLRFAEAYASLKVREATQQLRAGMTEEAHNRVRKTVNSLCDASDSWKARAERAESALAEALELLGVMYGWAKYGEESDHWYYSEEQAPGWKADSERASKLLGFKLKAKP